MESVPLLDRAGRRRSPATLSSFHQGRPPLNRGLRYPPDPPTVEEIIAVMHAAGAPPEGVRLHAVIVALWCAGLRISEALALTESDLDRERGAITVRRGKGGKRREVGMDRWGWEQLDPWLELRRALPHCSACCADRPAADRARPRESAASSAPLPSPPEFGVGSPPTSCVMRMRLRCPVKEFRCWSSSGSSGMPTSGLRRHTCVGSITPRSSTPSTNGRHP
jgi:Phage integrase family